MQTFPLTKSLRWDTTAYLGVKNLIMVWLFCLGKKMRLLEMGIPDFEDTQCRLLCAGDENTTIINVYVPNGSAVGSDKFEYKIKWLNALKTWLTRLAQEKNNLILLGDFNIAPDNEDVHDPELYSNQV